MPRHQATVGIVFDNPEDLGARIQMRYIGTQFEDDLNSHELNDYFVADLALWKKIGSKFDIFLGVENLFDKTFEVGRTGDGLVSVGAPVRIHLGARFGLGG